MKERVQDVQPKGEVKRINQQKKESVVLKVME